MDLDRDLTKSIEILTNALEIDFVQFFKSGLNKGITRSWMRRIDIMHYKNIIYSDINRIFFPKILKAIYLKNKIIYHIYRFIEK